MNVENLNCYRADKLILSQVALSVTAGDCIILRGPNGSGKTTLLRYLAGLSGELSPENIAYSGHLDGVKASLTVHENLSFWAGIYAFGNIDPILEKFSLASRQDRLAGDLSAGQKRRLGLARILMSKADVWLMDEPTVSLDKDTTAVILRAVKEHCATGGAAIISTHIDMDIPKARILNITDFAAQPADQNDPFLEGIFR